MRRPVHLAAIVAGVLAFVAVSALLARVLAANGAERTAIVRLLRAQARGDERSVVRQISGCASRPTCRSRVHAAVTVTRRSGRLQILRLDPSTGFSLGGTTGVARVAWNTTPTRRLTAVQCVRVHRGGNPVAGLSIELLALSTPIGREASCPKRF
jgi:hypothetical protein